ncbi:hypothetical protein [Roseovarius sp.]|uniref:hypothetical protein n=1 Tax=Roseovarius sp. TaxID=1486281 RepID=UPI003D0DEC91
MIIPVDLRVGPDHPGVDMRQAVLLDEPQRNVTDILLHPEFVRIDAQAALARHLKDTAEFHSA